MPLNSKPLCYHNNLNIAELENRLLEKINPFIVLCLTLSLLPESLFLILLGNQSQYKFQMEKFEFAD